MRIVKFKYVVIFKNLLIVILNNIDECGKIMRPLHEFIKWVEHLKNKYPHG